MAWDWDWEELDRIGSNWIYGSRDWIGFWIEEFVGGATSWGLWFLDAPVSSTLGPAPNTGQAAQMACFGWRLDLFLLFVFLFDFGMSEYIFVFSDLSF
jgi:hypothetical protein